MAGERVPVVLLPRFTTIVGQSAFNSLALDVRAYESIQLAIWRAPMIGGGTVFQASAFESMDRDTWADCSGSQDVDPGNITEVVYTWPLSKQWFRFQVNLLGADAGVTCWAQGYFVKRER